MIMKVVSTQVVDGQEYKANKFYEGDRIESRQDKNGLMFGVFQGQSDYWIELATPTTKESERYDIFLMENGRTFEHFNLG